MINLAVLIRVCLLYTSGVSVVDSNGNVIFQFTDLQGGTVTSLTLDGKTVTYKISVPNQYMTDGVPTREQEHLNVSASLDVSKLVLTDNYITRCV